ncbi:Hpt domain-containing protein [Shewanella khirikhana]|uniref:Hpt domain-containing protein n=1 Tax=Shewanella khirikhana TaxID=1965282 RepID=UPI0030CD859D
MTSPQDATPGIDIDQALARVGGNRALLHAVLGTFHESYQGLNERLHRLAEADDWESLRVLCHTLKGSSANVGAMRLSHSAGEVESQIKKGYLPVPAVLLHECLAAWDELSPTVAKLLASTEQQETFCVTATELVLRLAKLLTLIDTDFVAADSEFLALRQAQVPEKFQSDFSLFIKQFDAFDMPGAKASLNRMLGRTSDE